MIDEALSSNSIQSMVNYHIYIKVGDYYFQITRSLFSDQFTDTHCKVSRNVYEGFKSKRHTIILDINTISIDNCTINSIMSEIRISKLDKIFND